jgi:flagellar hook-associated protein 2
MGVSLPSLGSGIDTDSLVTQLMAIERQPRDLLATQQQSIVGDEAAWTTINGSLAALKAAADALSSPEKFAVMAASSSNPALATVTASAAAAPGAVTLTVHQLATSGQYASAPLASASAVVGQGSFAYAAGAAAAGITAVQPDAGLATGRHTLSVTQAADGSWQLTVDSDPATTYTVAAGDLGSAAGVEVGGFRLTLGPTLTAGTVTIGVATTDSATATVADLAAQIAKAGGPATAAVIDTHDATGQTQLVLTGTDTGAASALTIGTSGLSGLGAFRTLSAAQDAQVRIGDLTVNRPTNTLNDVIPGVTVTLARGPLAGDSTARSISDTLHDLLVSVPGGGSGTTRVLSQLGISVQRDGTFAFDATAFTSAYTADPTGVSTLLAYAAAALSAYASNSTGAQGLVQTAKDALDAQNRGIQDQLDNWDVRLSQIEDNYRREFTAMNVALNQLNQQGSWLAGQLSSLSGSQQ